jgi:RNA polymerase sigma factor (sigma-70 family)
MSESFDFYLKSIGKIPLLTADEEIHLGLIIREWQRHPNPPIGLEKRGRRAMNRMVNANLRLVVSACKHYQARAAHLLIDPMDLIQSANLGLIRAVELFDPCRGYKFSTYAYWWIRHGIMRYFQDHAGPIRLPAHVVETAIKARAISRELGASVPLNMVAKKLSVSSERLNFVLDRYAICRPLSLDQALGGADGDGHLSDIVSSEGPAPYSEDYGWIHSELACLDNHERLVLQCRYGSQSVVSLAKTAEQLGISKAKVQRIEHKALQHLRRRLSVALRGDPLP